VDDTKEATMMRSLALIGAAALCGCELDTFGIQGQDHGVVIVDTYNREFSWSDPSPCTVFLHRRVTDQKSHLVEYDVRMGTRELSVLFTVDPGSNLPLAARVFDGSGGMLVTIEADDHDLRVHDRDRSDVVAVAGYPGTAADTSIEVNGTLEDDDALALLRCALPLRDELGAIPPFLLNREEGGRLPGDPDISSTPTEQDPVLTEWDADLTLLGAFTRASVCLQQDGWACPCFHVEHPAAGEVQGWCEPIRPLGWLP
jgi:hypothetical protein